MYTLKKASLRIDESYLKCKNGCDYYGNEEWGGYCSKCHWERKKEARLEVVERGALKEKQQQSPLGFAKFEEKKRYQSDKKAKLLKVFAKSPNSKDRGKPESLFGPETGEAEAVHAEYQELFSKVGAKVENDIHKCIRSFYKKLLSDAENPLTSIDELSERAQNFYQILTARLDEETCYRGLSSEEKEQLIDYAEKYAMTCLYRILFCPATTTDEDKDLYIQKRIRQLNWVSAKHLDCGIDETNTEVHDLVYSSITELLGMDSTKAPQDKLGCVMRCCRKILHLMQKCIGGPTSADDFLPALIFVVLKANPARLKSNINYVTRFCNASKLMSGEGGYYFTNLCCAVSFIENLTYESLNMPEDEFNQYMSGKIIPSGTWESALIMCEGMHLINENLSIFGDLRKRHAAIMMEIEALKDEMIKFQDELLERVSDLRENVPLELRPIREPMDIDAEDPAIADLPPPLSPQIVEERVQPPRPRTPRQDSPEWQIPSYPDEALVTVNYDIDLSDLSGGEASQADDQPMHHSLDTGSVASLDLFRTSPPPLPPSNLSLLDNDQISPSLPSPIKPLQSSSSSPYQGFSSQGWQIPSIPCDTGTSCFEERSQKHLHEQQGQLQHQPVQQNHMPAQNQENSLGIKILGNTLEALDSLL
ncbi:rab5 GDP/GTP exchange factor isoform X1 [Halyomorpha halys]|uniref:rab5 GDP/GTP exchange factor isoform X1 n=1 Tax=Halyomorpha halys TaxID=286706 RepID=UPI0006D50A0A|nr:rab5 GDP/GTP exchange factor isoform X1 [Halyomorpha halys]XP_014272045.1 rab5 GDP/GTP exchange factor isoform X1 [Halyomorpha halys]